MMISAKAAGRIIGACTLGQMVGAALVNFVVLDSVFSPPGFLVNAAGHPLQMGLSVVLGLAAALLSVAIAIAAFPVIRQRSHAMALWLLALATAAFALSAVENSHVMSLLSLSEAYAKANDADRAIFQALRGVVASSRNWAHYLGLIVAGCTLFVLYGALLRFKLVPRILAALGLGAVVLQIIAVSMPLFGHDVVFPMLAPLGLTQLALALWLLVKGLPERDGDARLDVSSGKEKG
jgi:hypothetical protein